MGHDHSSPGIESQGHRSGAKVDAKMCGAGAGGGRCPRGQMCSRARG